MDNPIQSVVVEVFIVNAWGFDVCVNVTGRKVARLTMASPRPSIWRHSAPKWKGDLTLFTEVRILTIRLITKLV